jgi:hypothetical protein
MHQICLVGKWQLVLHPYHALYEMLSTLKYQYLTHHSLGAKVKGYALNPPTSPSLFNEAKIESIITSEIGDIRNQDKLHKSMTTFNLFS